MSTLRRFHQISYDRGVWVLWCLLLGALLYGSVAVIQSPAIASDDPAEVGDLPGFGIWGPAYRLRQVPAGMQLVVRASADRSARMVGALKRTATEVLVINCSPAIDPQAYDSVDRVGKHALLDRSWCQIDHFGMSGYIPGIYLDPILGR